MKERMIDMNKKLDELQKLAIPLKEYLEKNYDQHCAVIVECDGVKIIRDEMYLPMVTVNRPPEEFIPEDSRGKFLNTKGTRCPN